MALSLGGGGALLIFKLVLFGPPLSAYQPHKGGGRHRSCWHWSWLRRSQLVSRGTFGQHCGFNYISFHLPNYGLSIVLFLDFLRSPSAFSAFHLRVPKGLEDVSKYPHLFAALLESDKWSEEDIAKLAGRNLIRVFKEVEAVSPQQKTYRNCSLFSGIFLLFTGLSPKGCSDTLTKSVRHFRERGEQLELKRKSCLFFSSIVVVIS